MSVPYQFKLTTAQFIISSIAKVKQPLCEAVPPTHQKKHIFLPYVLRNVSFFLEKMYCI